MQIFQLTFLLFLLNLLDAVCTVFWVRNGLATEGNVLMASLLDMGDIPFILVKVAIGAVCAFVLYNWYHYKAARLGLTIALGVYICLMGLHLLTGLAAAGIVSGKTINEFSIWSDTVFAFIV